MHIAIIPARMASQRLKFKNRILFRRTADFLDQIPWMDQVIVSTDDPIVERYATDRRYVVHRRLACLSGPAISIKQVMESVVKDNKIKGDEILWLFYLPLIYKNMRDFEACKSIIENSPCKSLCSFIEARTHPYNCWKYNTAKQGLSQYIENDVFRSQDMPPAWAHYHYICCLRVCELSRLNSELLNSRTYPYFLDSHTRDRLIEIDSPLDVKKWEELTKEKI